MSLSVGRTPLGASLDEQSNTPTKGDLPTAQPHALSIKVQVHACVCGLGGIQFLPQYTITPFKNMALTWPEDRAVSLKCS